jgi:hypothetical protein
MPAPTPSPAFGDRTYSPALPALIVGTPATETLEVRWWHDRPLPVELHDLCAEAAGSGGELEHRVDTYLVHCGDDLSVKVRGGEALDIKQRCGPVTASVLVAGVEGRVEQWRKWTFGSVAGSQAGHADAPTSSREAEAAQHWVPVAKTRCKIEEGSATVELTEIRTSNRLHWTVALEAPVESGLAGLRDAAATLELGRFPRWFGVDTSASYATFVEPPGPVGLELQGSG